MREEALAEGRQRYYNVLFLLPVDICDFLRKAKIVTFAILFSSMYWCTGENTKKQRTLNDASAKTNTQKETNVQAQTY